MNPYGYQLDAGAQIAATRKKGGRSALVLMAPGLGKTVVAARDVQAFLAEKPNSRVLVLSHRETINRQNERTFRAVLGDINTGFAMSNEAENLKAQFLFGSIGYVGNRLGKLDPKRFDYVIMDESHHDPAPTFRRVINHFEPQFRLGLTGSTHRLDRRAITGVFGEPVYSLSLARALARGYLPPINYYLVGDTQLVDLTHTKGLQISRKQLNEQYFSRNNTEALAHRIKQDLSQHGLTKVLIFARNVDHAETLHATIGGEIMHSKRSRLANAQAFAALRTKPVTRLTSVDMLSEGVDVPSVDLVVLERLTESESLWTQQIGRGARNANGKTGLTVYDYAGNVERIIQMRRFAAEVERESDLHRDELDAEGRSHENQTRSGVAIHFDRVAVNLIEALEETERPRPTSRTEVLDHVIPWIVDNDGRVPRHQDFLASTELPSYDRVIDMWSTDPPAHPSFLRALFAEYEHRREFDDDMPPLERQLRPEPRSKPECLEILLSWTIAHEGRIPSSGDFISDKSLPALSHTNRLWSKSMQSKRAINFDLIELYRSRQAANPGWPELQVTLGNITRPEPATLEEFLDLVVDWTAANGGKMPGNNMYRVGHPSLPRFECAQSFFVAEPSDPVRNMNWAIADRYEARRQTDASMPELRLPRKNSRPHPESRQHAVEIVVEKMVAVGGRDVGDDDFANDRRSPLFLTLVQQFHGEQNPTDALRRAAHTRYEERRVEDTTMPPPTFVVMRPEATSKEEILEVVLPWMARNGGNRPTSRDFATDRTLPSDRVVQRAWANKTTSSSSWSAFEADAVAAYAVWQQEHDTNAPEVVVATKRPQPKTQDDVLDIVVEWMRHNQGKVPEYTDYLNDRTLPTVETAFALWPRGTLGSKHALDVDAVAAYQLYVDPSRPNLKERNRRPAVETREDAIQAIAGWVIEHDGVLPTPSRFRGDLSLPLLKRATQYFDDSYDQLMTEVTELLGEENVNGTSRQMSGPSRTTTQRFEL